MIIKNKFDTKNYEFNTKSQYGIYIIHGFTSTTYETKDLAEYLANNGFHTVSNNLPGHGTTIEDCNATLYKEWLTFIEQDFARLISETKYIYVVGISMGGALALHLSTLFPVDGLVSAATVLQFNDHFKLRWFNPITKYFFTTFDKRKRYPKSIRKTLIFHGYDKYPMKALSEFFKMAKIIRNKLHMIHAPILILHSNGDVTSRKENINIIKNGISSKNIQIKKYKNATHNMFIKSEDQKHIFHDILSFFKEIK